MAAEHGLAREVAHRQVAMFAMFVGQGRYTTRNALAAASGYPSSTLKDWANGVAMPFHAVLGLRKFLPGEAVNMLAEPGGVRLVDAEQVETSWDGIAAESARKEGRRLIADAQSAVGAE
jgi:hypothetical protein